ncbi:MAG: redoxin domain-containing protein [Gammaproteobacteria bacterium]|nr:redoxin domain-containing protein [Gammaproteobacteria bacterium]
MASPWIRNSLIAALCATAVILAAWWPNGGSLRAAVVAPELAGTAAAPDFPEGLDWINTNGEPLSLEDLRGKVVLLDFWTYGCINCYHIIPDLKRLMAKHGDALVVVGVHSAKFASEGDTRRIRMIAQRYERDEPIVNDRGFAIWTSYGARAWPTLVLIDPAGNVVGKVAGEGHYELLDDAITRLLETFEARDAIDRTPLPFGPAPEPDTFLRFPGKVIANGRHIYIADSNNHRILETDLAGKLKRIFGTGEPGLADGAASDARFRQPQGLALDGNGRLYVADTLNSAIRRIHLDSGEVETLAGTGEQIYMTRARYAAGGTPLNSPWDVLWHDGDLFIAMAGQHQLWRLDPQNDVLERYAGSGREALQDGRRLEGGLNQPSGLATDGKQLFFADSEASAIRYIDFDNNRMNTIVGTGLFDFGDVDGKGDHVRLQHPLGVTYANGVLYVADTYNDKIKVVDPAERTSRTLIGGKGELFEPGGLHFANNRLYIADTNQHRIMVYDFATGELAELEIAE